MVPRFTLGDCELFFLSGGAFWLDGGALFGVVLLPFGAVGGTSLSSDMALISPDASGPQ